MADRRGVVAAWVLVGAFAGGARAQVGGGAGALPGAPGTASSLANPYANPYMNPYLNPYMMTQPGASPGRTNTLLYFMAAQQQQGILSNPAAKKGQAATKAPGRTTERVAEVPRAVMEPGASAAKYFLRGNPKKSATKGQSRVYFHRYDGHFGNNGH